MKTILICLILFSSIRLCHAQILNVEQQRIITDTTGWAGKIGLTASASKFTKALFTFNTSTHVQYKDNKNLYLFVLNYDILSADGVRFDNRGYAHLRYNRKWNNIIRWEAFTQVQFNSLTKIRVRWLTGSGLRFKLSELENAKYYLGLTYMFEYEELFDPKIFHNDHRLSSYFTSTWIIQKNIRITNTSYFQPLFRNFSDFRISNDTNISIEINKHLRLTTIFGYLFDSNPPTDIPMSNYIIRNGINYKF